MIGSVHTRCDHAQRWRLPAGYDGTLTVSERPAQRRAFVVPSNPGAIVARPGLSDRGRRADEGQAMDRHHLPQDLDIDGAAKTLSAAAWLPADEREYVRAAIDDWLRERFWAMPSTDPDALATLIDDIERLRAIDASVVRPETLADLKRVQRARRRKRLSRLAAGAGIVTPFVIPVEAFMLTVLGQWTVPNVLMLVALTVLGGMALWWTRARGTYYFPVRSEHLPRVRVAQDRLRHIAAVLAPSQLQPVAAAPLVARTAPRPRQRRHAARRASGTRSGNDPGDNDPAPPPHHLDFVTPALRLLVEAAPC